MGSTPHLHIWNDMNEMSVFNGPEVTMQKTARNLAGVEHREWHNVYGMLFQRATAEGLVKRSEGKERPFVLSRSFFAGSQRWGAVWTGDNAARWDHLAAVAPMLLSMNVAGLPFVGADVGGFFGNVGEELMVRWMQAGAYQPFFRGHAHHDSARREPWLFGDAALGRMRKAAMERYALLPFWYTVFQEASETGVPAMRPLWMSYPTDGSAAGLDHQWTVGEDVLVCPVVTEGATKVNCYFPGDEPWYDSRTLKAQDVPPSKWVNVDAPIDIIPVYQRGGSVVPKRMRLRRSTEMMRGDPYTLFVAPSRGKQAKGRLYVDDEHSHDFQDGEYALREFRLEGRKITNSKVSGRWGEKDECTDWIERIVVMASGGLGVKKVTVEGTGRELEFVEENEVLVIRKPELGVTENWTIELS